MEGMLWAFGRRLTVIQTAKFMGPTWGPPGSCRPQMGPMLVPWTLLSGYPQDQSITRNNRATKGSLFIPCTTTFRINVMYVCSIINQWGGGGGGHLFTATQTKNMDPPWGSDNIEVFLETTSHTAALIWVLYLPVCVIWYGFHSYSLHYRMTKVHY